MKNRFLIASVLSIILPAVPFGNWTLYSTTSFIICFLIIMKLLHSKIKEKEEPFWITPLIGGVHGLMMASIGILVFATEINGTFIKSSIGIEFLIYLSSAIPFSIITNMYRKTLKEEYIKSFPSEKALERDRILNKILNE